MNCRQTQEANQLVVQPGFSLKLGQDRAHMGTITSKHRRKNTPCQYLIWWKHVRDPYTEHHVKMGLLADISKVYDPLCLLFPEPVPEYHKPHETTRNSISLLSEQAHINVKIIHSKKLQTWLPSDQLRHSCILRHFLQQLMELVDLQ